MTQQPQHSHPDQPERSGQSQYVIRAGGLAHDAYELDLSAERAGWEWSSLRVLALEPGQGVDVPGGEHEFLVLPLSGGCTVEVEGEAAGQTLEVTGRDSVFTDITDYVYVPRRTDVRLTSAQGARIALPGARATTDKPLRYCPREEVGTGLRGAGPSSRQVSNYALGNEVETSHLLACEVLTPGGNWSSYPPHKHDEHTEVERVLEEIYYYQVREGADGAQGFALQRIYPSPGHDIDVCTEVRDGDVVVMPYGYHGPSVAAPGYDLYYLNVMAGPAEDSVWLMTDDPHHTWVRQTWQTQEVDPRLPMTPMN
ncbi:5-deoxy-glucuronate isomerase [Actinomyces sp. 2119]|uniref:5-deoxy-glucuronate isomerase n=1 Tax=Actinomyces lilanjuaniae TaxID=2321394 RepID=A0ABM6Z4J4_9ACTO|nr:MULTISPECIES: 5-deoxy-glucuronate isomerase [Actinomyces]AYD90207.1 5-deoxy-glucuronate isomerase [Actinomyces lilanjuaniae]RJF41465.1 5-deoxy-glucuronate isomerase [Actinomyces sp. 2119]